MTSGKRIIALASLISFLCSRTMVVDWAAILIWSAVCCAVQAMDLEQNRNDKGAAKYKFHWLEELCTSVFNKSGWWCETHSLSPDPHIGIEEVHCCITLVIQHLGGGGGGGGGKGGQKASVARKLNTHPPDINL